MQIISQEESRKTDAEIKELDAQIKEILDNFIRRMIELNREEIYKLARTEFIIDQIIAETREKIRKTPAFRGRIIAKLSNKIDYFEKERGKIINEKTNLNDTEEVMKASIEYNE